jgi:EmrB/QacA subfamily drug resistance transporter
VGRNNRWLVLFICSLSSFLVPFMTAAVNVSLASISKDLSLNAVVLGWIPMAYLLASAIFLVPFGRVADIYGAKKVFIFGMLLYTLSCLLLPFSQTATMLISFSVMEGIGAAASYSTSMVILNTTYQSGERGRALGITTATVYAGLSLGPLIGGFMTQHLSWRSIFLINVPLGILVVALMVWKMRGEQFEAKPPKMDYAGSLIYGLGLSALILGFSRMPTSLGIWLAAGGLAGLGLFVWWELKISSPVLNIRIFKNSPVFTWSSLAALINYAATNAIVFLLSLYLQYIKGFSTEHAGLILIAQPIVQMTLSPISGRLSDRLQPQVVASIGMSLTTLGLALLAMLNENSSLWYIILTLILLGMGFGLFVAPNTNAAISSVDKRNFGVASGIIGTMRSVGQLVSLATAVMIFAIIIGHVQITPPFYPLFLESVRVAFTIFASLCFIGIFASLARGKMKR